GSVRGFELAQSKYGSQKWDALIAPAIELATKGYVLSYKSAELLRSAHNLSEDPESKRIFQKGGSFYDAGDVFVQPELAATLKRIAASGARGFYEGEIARRLASEMSSHGGLITLADLQRYRAVERTPLSGSYRGLTVLTAPLPSSGGIGILQMLGMLEGSGYGKAGPGAAATIHYTAE